MVNLGKKKGQCGFNCTKRTTVWSHSVRFGQIGSDLVKRVRLGDNRSNRSKLGKLGQIVSKMANKAIIPQIHFEGMIWVPRQKVGLISSDSFIFGQKGLDWVNWV